MPNDNAKNMPEYSTPFAPSGGAWPARETFTLGDGYETGVFHHKPATANGLAPVLYLHGIQSHPGWFFRSAEKLAANGHDVFQATRRGCGANKTDRGHVVSTRRLLDDVRRKIRFVLERTGAERLAIAGVSWGGKLAVAACCAAVNNDAIESLTLIAPGIIAQIDVPAATKLKVAACLLARPKAMCDIPLNDPKLFTDNEPIREFLRDDPLALRQATVRFMYVSRRLDNIIKRSGPGVLKMPTTLILSNNDSIIDSDATGRVVTQLTDRRAEITTLSGKHTLEFEQDPGEFHRSLLAACAKRR